jgi:hypothetical protein
MQYTTSEQIIKNYIQELRGEINDLSNRIWTNFYCMIIGSLGLFFLIIIHNTHWG